MMTKIKIKLVKTPPFLSPCKCCVLKHITCLPCTNEPGYHHFELVEPEAIEFEIVKSER